MTEFLKTARKTANSGEDATRDKVHDMLADIESGGESRALFVCCSLVPWAGTPVGLGAGLGCG